MCKLLKYHLLQTSHSFWALLSFLELQSKKSCFSPAFFNCFLGDRDALTPKPLLLPLFPSIVKHSWKLQNHSLISGLKILKTKSNSISNKPPAPDFSVPDTPWHDGDRIPISYGRSARSRPENSVTCSPYARQPYFTLH